MILGIAAAAILLGAAATASTTPWSSGPEFIGICHATGSGSNPYVYLVVEKNGYEHGHHRHHPHDFFVDPARGHCDDDDALLPPDAPGAGEGDAGTDTGSDDADDEMPESDDEAEAAPDDPADDTGAPSDDGATSDEDENGAGDEGAPGGDEPAADDEVTEDDGTSAPDAPDNGTAPGGNETAPGNSANGNETAPGNGANGNETAPGDDSSGNETASEAADGGDAAVSVVASQDDHRVTLLVTITSRGPGDARDVVVTSTLPDLRRPWSLGGADASRCVLEDRSLSCWFGDLEEGEGRDILVQSFTDRLPCGESMTATVRVQADGDPEPRNDASSASIFARYC